MLIKETISRFPEISALELLGEVNEFLQTESVKTILEHISPKEYDSLIEDALIESLETMNVLTESDGRSDFITESKMILEKAGILRRGLSAASTKAKAAGTKAKELAKELAKKIVGNRARSSYRMSRRHGKGRLSSTKGALKKLPTKSKVGIAGGATLIGAGGIGGAAYLKTKKKKK